MTKVIVVEDDPMISEIYERKFLESGFEVHTASSGDQVLGLVKKEKADLILLDLIMPKMDGFEVISKVRNGQYDKDIKIIVFSNLSQKEDREKAMKLGANGFIAKSDFTPSGLIAEVKRQINQMDEEKKNEFRNGSIDDGIEKKRVLMVEDEAIFAEMFGEKLRQDGFEVETAMDGALGLKKALTGKFDIFIVDVVLPGISGEEIVAKIKMNDETKNIPIIVFSASLDKDAEKRIKDSGVAAFLVKTQIIPSDLSKKVAEILN
jgi:DNA-binding response OmpR family regulator